jgi:two-component system sporulation sensor kinase B
VIQFLLLPVIHGLLYIIAACLLFLVVSPKFLFQSNRRMLFFVIILIVLSFIYLGFDQQTPVVYALHLTPLSIALAALFEGVIPGVATWVAFVFCGIIIVGTNWLPTILACSILLVLGLILHYRLEDASLRRMSLLSAVLVAVHLGVYVSVLWMQGMIYPYKMTITIVLITLASSQLTSYIYFYVKHQERLQRELILSEKYQLIGQLAASISHEIRNPLTTTRGFLQLMNKEDLSQEAFERYRTYAFEGIDHANSIITDYLNFSKPNMEEPKLLNVKDEVDGIVPWLQPFSILSNTSVEIHHMMVEPMYIMGEPKKFQQCLLNVMKNAIESMTTGGVLSVHTRLEQGKVQILIRDTGIGMSSKQVKKLGNPYFTTKESGTGLGLMVVISLVKAMNGKIYFRSKPNEGTICEMHFELVSEKKNL